MRLVSFSVQKYRSITTANKLPVKDCTTLIGPNNEGKSNILRALVTALGLLQELSRGRLHRGRVIRTVLTRSDYSWVEDFPLSLQEKSPEGKTVFNIEFRLTEEEVKEFTKEVGSKLNGNLPIKLSVSPNEIEFKVVKKGRGGTALSKKDEKIAKFVARRINVNYIPAVRTADAAQRVVEHAVSRELSRLEDDPEYLKAINKIDELQAPIFEEMASQIKGTLGEFLPQVTNVEVAVSSASRTRALRRSCEIIVDDGTPTTLDRKGDGVQSLAALSLMRSPPTGKGEDREMILAIEEPEAHLHPQAIHQLKRVLADIAESNQVIMTTHCPLFVDRTAISSNIIVHKKRATPAKSVNQIREVLGVRSSDNLQNAALVLVVEGEHDRTVLQAILPKRSKILAKALKQGALGIESLHGGANLSYKLSQLRESICSAHCFIDNDKAGIAAIEKAEREGLLMMSEYHLTTCPGKSEAEMEDFFPKESYEQVVKNQYGVSLTSPKFRSNKKWSERMKETFKSQGKPWSDKIEKSLKSAVADIVAGVPENAIGEHCRESFDALVAALEERLLQIESGKG